MLRALLVSFLLVAPALSGEVAGYQEEGVTGYPHYLEGKTGGIVSDFGSHYGIKTSADKKLGLTTYYSALSSLTSGLIDRSWIEVDTKDERIFSDVDERSVNFRLYGWEEEAESGDIKGRYRTAFIGTDRMLMIAEISADDDAEMRPVIRISGRTELKKEGMAGFAPALPFVSDSMDENTFIIGKRFDMISANQMFSSPLQMLRDLTTYRAFTPSFRIEDVKKKVSPTGYDYELIGGPFRGSMKFWVTVGFSQDSGKAAELSLLASNPEELWLSVDEDWKSFIESLPPIRDERYRDLYEMAATALRMGLYAPRNGMERYCAVPNKPHFPFFFGWDTPLQALGIAQWDAGLAEEVLMTQFQSQFRSGSISITVDDSVRPAFYSFFMSQPPVQSMAVTECYLRDPDRERAVEFLELAYAHSIDFLEFWEKRRDLDRNGLSGYLFPLESGWDDTPRYVQGLSAALRRIPAVGNMLSGVMPALNFDAVDLNCWLCRYYTDMALWADELGYDSDVWRVKAEDLAQRIEDEMWSEEDGCWFDLSGGEFVKVETPAIWFPAFMGITKNETRVKRVIEEHMLDPQRFFGRYPIPSVAYDSPYYDKARDGFYWQGQVWLITLYSAVKTLDSAGYDEERNELVSRAMEMMSDKGGIYETYNALTGDVGWGSGGVGNPSCFQFGWSSTVVLLLLTREPGDLP
jgi:hypothetical protein